VEDLAFDENSSQQPVSVPGQVLATAENSPVLVKYAALLLGLLIVVAFAVRPALRGLRLAPKQLARAGSKNLLAGSEVAPKQIPSPVETAEPDPERIRVQEIFDQVSGHLKREPAQSSRLLQSWIHSSD